MPKAITKEEKQSIRDRIQEIATERGGPSILARIAGLAPSTVSQYLSEEKGRASEPGVGALIRLADAAGVSISWLAAGRGPKSAVAELPPGFRLFPFFDLKSSGWLMNTFDQPESWIALKESWLDREGGDLGEIVCFETPENLGQIVTGDVLAVDGSYRGGSPWRRQPFNLIEGGIYAIVQDARILVRALRWQTRGEIIVAESAARSSKALTIERVQVLGLVVWRGGRVTR